MPVYHWRMTRRMLAIVLTSTALVIPLGALQPRESVRVSTMTVTVERVEPGGRGLVVRDQFGMLQAIAVDPAVTPVDGLAAGDVIVIDVIEAVVASLKPGASLTTFVDTTREEQARVTDPLVKIQQQLTAVVTIDEVNLAAQTVVYHGKDNRRVLRQVMDPTLLQGLHPGDVVEVTITRARAVSIKRAPR
jgi:hypothetical protein